MNTFLYDSSNCLIEQQKNYTQYKWMDADICEPYMIIQMLDWEAA